MGKEGEGWCFVGKCGGVGVVFWGKRLDWVMGRFLGRGKEKEGWERKRD